MDAFSCVEALVTTHELDMFPSDEPLDSSPVDQERYNAGNYGAFCIIT